MFAKRNRLPHFVILTPSRVIHHSLFLVKYRENTLSDNRFAVSVSKRIDKRAVVRNRLRRVLQHCLREMSFKENTHVDMLFVVKKSFFDTSTADICATLTSLLEKENLV